MSHNISLAGQGFRSRLFRKTFSNQRLLRHILKSIFSANVLVFFVSREPFYGYLKGAYSGEKYQFLTAPLK